MTYNEIIMTLKEMAEYPRYSVEDKILENVIDFILYQQAEIERLGKEVNLVSIQFQDLQERYEEAQTKIDEFMKETAVTTLIDDAVVYTPTLEDYNKFKKKFKSEAVKEFAERIKEFMHNKFKALDEYEFEYITERDIDNLVKEMVGENNATT